MSNIQILRAQDYKRLSWKNGLGFTAEIAIQPPGAELKKGNFLWRLSSARIEQSSPFSIFPEHDRFLVILEGAGVTLTHTFEEVGAEEKVELSPLTPYEFPGDIPSRCTLSSGGVTDLSLFIRKGEVEAQVEVIELDDTKEFPLTPLGKWNFIYVVSGSIHAGTDQVKSGDTVCFSPKEQFHDGEPLVLKATGPTRLVLLALNN